MCRQRYLSELGRCGFEIHLVSTSSNLSASDRRKVEREGVRVHCRENAGMDFASWQWALRHVVPLAEVDCQSAFKFCTPNDTRLAQRSLS